MWNPLPIRVAEEVARGTDLGIARSGAKLDFLIDALNGLGFEASLEENGGNYAITSLTCPFLKAA